MARQTLGLGEHGEIEAVAQKRDAKGLWKNAPHSRSADRWRARAWFRGHDGVLREVSKFAKVKRDAIAKVEEHLDELGRSGLSGMTASMPLVDAAAYWRTQVHRGDSGFAAKTLKNYRDALRNHVVGDDSSIKGLTLRQVNDPQRLRLFLQAVADNVGTAAAKVARSVVAGILNMAIADGVLDASALRQVKPVKQQAPSESRHDKKRSMTRKERDDIVALGYSRAEEEGLLPRTQRVRRAVADLAAFMAGTGARIDEARAMEWSWIDLETGRCEIRGTKSETSDRVVWLPEWLLVRLRARAKLIGTDGLVFPTPGRSDPWRRWDQSTSSAEVRELLDAAGLTWAVAHTFRRTLATLLDKAGWALSDIADQLGHADPSMTARVYLGRDKAGAHRAPLAKDI